MKIKALILTFSIILLGAGCTSVHKTMREPNAYMELSLEDFTLSEQVTAEATSTKILYVDWQRLFRTEKASVRGAESMLINLASIPVMGNYIFDQTANYALYELMVQNPGYDVVIYPQYETITEKPVLGIGFFKIKTTVKVTARLGKLK